MKAQTTICGALLLACLALLALALLWTGEDGQARAPDGLPSPSPAPRGASEDGRECDIILATNPQLLTQAREDANLWARVATACPELVDGL